MSELTNKEGRYIHLKEGEIAFTPPKVMDIRQLAEKHWEYTEAILVLGDADMSLALIKYLYVEAMIHGYKHAKEESIGKLANPVLRYELKDE